MTKKIKVTLTVSDADGWFVAVCKELKVSGFGQSREDAIASLFRSMQSFLAFDHHVACSGQSSARFARTSGNSETPIRHLRRRPQTVSA